MSTNMIRSIMNTGPLNILVIGVTHERYEQQLAKTGHRFLSILTGDKDWNIDYGPIPSNYEIYDSIPDDFSPDIILLHTNYRADIAKALRLMYGVPVVRVTHTLPTSKEEIFHFTQYRPDLDVFISEYSMREWGGGNNSFVVDHGLDNDFWQPQPVERKPVILSCVNQWQSRDWACGWNLYVQVRNLLPQYEFKILGTNPGLSNPAPSLEALRHELSECSVFLNTSLHSPIPMALLEAMACGAPIVTTDTCMIPDYVENNVSGLFGRNAGELADAIKDLMENKEKREYFSIQASKTIAEKYNISKFINSWEEILQSVKL